MRAAQAYAAARLAILSAPRRRGSSASTSLAIALMVALLLGFLAMGNGFKNVLAGAGSPGVAIILQDGANSAQGSALTPEQITALETAPGIQRDHAGQAEISPELSLPVSLDRLNQAGQANLLLHGIAPDNPLMLKNVALVSGRAPRPGSRELIVGKAAAQEFMHLGLGDSVFIAGSKWPIVGIFRSNGSIYESEARGDLYVIRSVLRKDAPIQNVRAVTDGPDGTKRLERYLRSNPQLSMMAISEVDYFINLSRTTGTFIQKLGWPLALVMALGALSGAANSMSISVDARAGEILTLRAIGFSRISIFFGVVVEAVALAILGSFIGIVLALLIFEGAHSSTVGSTLGQVIFEFRISYGMILQAIFLAVTVGVLGAIFPAIGASRMQLALAGQE